MSISAGGNRVAIGANLNNGANGLESGHVRVYDFLNGDWIQVGADIDGEDAFGRSGWAVSLSADGARIAIGAPRNPPGSNNRGQVRIYELLNLSLIHI